MTQRNAGIQPEEATVISPDLTPTRPLGLFKIPSAERINRARDRKVDFVIAGTEKGGTTALDAYLRLNPRICMPHKRKEVHFFNADGLFGNTEPDYRLYHAFFKPKSWHRVLGEATPGYMYSEDAGRRILEYNPGMKVLLSLRNPIDRAYSHWNMYRARGFESLSFGEAIRTEEARLRATALGERWRDGWYVDRGFYTEQIRRLKRNIPIRQILILRQEDLRDDHEKTLESVWRFLDVEPVRPPEKIEEQVGQYAEAMTDSDRDYLKDIYQYEIRSLEVMLGWDCRGWLT